MRKWELAIVTAALVSLLVACNDGKTEPNKENQETEQEQVVEKSLEMKLSTPLEAAETFMRSYYFDEGTYKEYQQLFLSKDNMKTEDEFNNYRLSTDTSDIFGEVKIKTVEDTFPHLKVREIDEDTAEVYFVTDPKDEKFETAQFYWILKKENNQWLMEM